MIDAQLISKIINDADITWKAKGIFMYMLSFEPGERIDLNTITTNYEGRGATRNGINELIISGYIRRESMRTNTGYYYRLFSDNIGGVELNWFKTGVECVSPDKFGDVYVLHNKANRLTKIGFSTDAKSRVKSLQFTFPESEPILVQPGTRKDEYDLHEHFIANKKHKHGEWFSLDNDDIRYIVDFFNAKSR